LTAKTLVQMQEFLKLEIPEINLLGVDVYINSGTTRQSGALKTTNSPNGIMVCGDIIIPINRSLRCNAGYENFVVGPVFSISPSVHSTHDANDDTGWQGANRRSAWLTCLHGTYLEHLQ
jgi:hypothetical protein